ncbi:hypothetical protein MLD52_16225 [Puniceicoccaceae bacterium K14]|nr:hypothetical protein [Puniceicoccaceae bacterium K14]
MKTLKAISAITALSALFAFSSCKPGSSDAEAKQPLNPGKELLYESIEAHGGIEKWRSNGLFKFRWTYHMTDRGATVDSIQTIDPVNFTAVHTVPNSETTFGRSEEGRYWIHPADASFMPPVQFWTLTPLYFIGIPFVFHDDQITFELLDETKKFEGKDYPQVKLSYSSSAGESPDDYYVLLIDPDTKLVRGAYYTVTNPLVFKGGTPVEKFITLDNLQEIGGLKIAGGHKTYAMPDGEIAEEMRYTDVSEVAFIERGMANMAPPEGASFLDAVPTAE